MTEEAAQEIEYQEVLRKILGLGAEEIIITHAKDLRGDGYSEENAVGSDQALIEGILEGGGYESVRIIPKAYNDRAERIPFMNTVVGVKKVGIETH